MSRRPGCGAGWLSQPVVYNLPSYSSLCISFVMIWKQTIEDFLHHHSAGLQGKHHPSKSWGRHSSLRETHLARTWLLTLLPPVLWRTRHFHYSTVVVSVRGLSTKTTVGYSNWAQPNSKHNPPALKQRLELGCYL